MRLFKRQSSDTSPQLVSATPISQDGAAPAMNENSEKNEKRPSPADVDGEGRTSVKAVANDSQKATPQNCVSNRKGISTWGRKVGRRWDQLKRSDSTELLSVSSRRRRWSPNRKSLGSADEKNNVTKASPELPKPKRISRVESLRNLFRSSERNNNCIGNDLSSRNITIHEEDDSCAHYPMEKALSEGAIKNMPFQLSADDSQVNRGNLLQEKKKQLSRSIQDLQEQQRVLDFILKNQEILKTQEGTTLARETLDKARRGDSPKRKSQSSDAIKSSMSTQTREFFSNQLSNIRRNLFSVRASTSDQDRTEAPRQCAGTGLEELMSNLRLGSDESGYDSDSTRAGADSPDSGKSVPQMLKPRSFSITSDDYHGVDLSLPVSTPKKFDTTPEIEEENPMESSCLDDTVILNKSLLNETVRTDVTALASDDDDTDSCDEDTFEGFAEFEMTFGPPSAENPVSRCDTGLSTMPSTSSSVSDNFEPHKMSSVKDQTGDCVNENETEKAEKKLVSRSENSVNLSQTVKMQNMQKETKSQIPLKLRKHTNGSSLNLLENAASPCKDSPPATKVYAPKVNNLLSYYSPKRTRSNTEIEAAEAALIRSKVKKSLASTKIERPTLPTPSSGVKSLARRELKTMKLIVEKAGNLGISVEKRDAVRPYYVISKMDANGEAAKSKLFKIGDEIVRVSGRRLRGMTITEARSALRNCMGTVELQIAREPTFTFGEEPGDTWGDALTRTRSDSEVWTLKDIKQELVPSVTTEVSQEKRETSTCQIVGALRKDGKNLSVDSMDRMETECDLSVKTDSEQKMTGMRKFHVVKKRTTNLTSCPRRATSLSMDLLTITLEKGAQKKLGFSIVGGSDSNKGSMGIFVKEIMTGGQAAEEGTLRVGDEILAINGISMDGLTHAKALQTFKAAKAGKMILHVGRRDPTHKRYIIQSKSYDCLDKLTETGDE